MVFQEWDDTSVFHLTFANRSTSCADTTFIDTDTSTFGDILTIAAAVALIDFKLSPQSINTHELNCLVGVLTPPKIGVGSENLNVEAPS